MEIRQMVPEDWEAVRAIYLEGIATGQATFETSTPSWGQWNSSHLSFARLIAASQPEGSVKGWAALAPVSGRAVYAGVAEVSVYIARDSKGQGLGQQLLTLLIAESETNGMWMLQASVFPENLASIALHERCGFRAVGIRERIGRINKLWRDTLLLERRSRVVGSN
ncbi:MAG: N-acetyltransferase family protein [Acidobacteriota bacterium]|nr:N-acetyltransferase family protein [Acidobacteriota bacterium]